MQDSKNDSKNIFRKTSEVIVNVIHRISSGVLKTLSKESQLSSEKAKVAKGELSAILKAIKSCRSLSEISSLASQAKSLVDMYPDELGAYKTAIEEMEKLAQAAIEREQATGQKYIEAAEAQLRQAEQAIIDRLAREGNETKKELHDTYQHTNNLVDKVLNGTEEEKATAMKGLIEKNKKKNSVNFNDKAIDYLNNLNQRMDIYEPRKERNGGILSDQDTAELNKLKAEKVIEKDKFVDESVTRVFVRAAEIQARGSHETETPMTSEQVKKATNIFGSNVKDLEITKKIKEKVSLDLEQAEVKTKSGEKQGEVFHTKMENLAREFAAKEMSKDIEKKTTKGTTVEVAGEEGVKKEAKSIIDKAKRQTEAEQKVAEDKKPSPTNKLKSKPADVPGKNVAYLLRQKAKAQQQDNKTPQR
jgi:hypothetical protein